MSSISPAVCEQSGIACIRDDKAQIDCDNYAEEGTLSVSDSALPPIKGVNVSPVSTSAGITCIRDDKLQPGCNDNVQKDALSGLNAFDLMFLGLVDGVDMSGSTARVRGNKSQLDYLENNFVRVEDTTFLTPIKKVDVPPVSKSAGTA